MSGDQSGVVVFHQSQLVVGQGSLRHCLRCRIQRKIECREIGKMWIKRFQTIMYAITEDELS